MGQQPRTLPRAIRDASRNSLNPSVFPSLPDSHTSWELLGPASAHCQSSAAPVRTSLQRISSSVTSPRGGIASTTDALDAAPVSLSVSATAAALCGESDTSSSSNGVPGELLREDGPTVEILRTVAEGASGSEHIGALSVATDLVGE